MIIDKANAPETYLHPSKEGVAANMEKAWPDM
jgi:hypothetical protein